MDFLLGLLLLASPIHATVEENEIAARLTQDATEFLDKMLGPGRAKVLVTVEGERSDVQTQTEVTTPILKLDEQGNKVMPGYSNTQNANKIDYYQKDLETSNRRGGFRILKLRAAIVLDTSLSDPAVDTVRRLLPDLLRMDPDDMTVLRAPLLPAWKTAFLAPDGLRSAAVFVGAFVGLGLLAILLCIALYFTAMRVTRTFVVELALRRPQAPLPGGPFPQGAEAQIPGGGGLPPLGPGGIPSLADAIDVTEGSRRDLPALGRRFDFLSSKDPAELSELLTKEPPEDLALLFAYLAESHTDMASRVFAALPGGVQSEVSSMLVKLNIADPERLAMLENRLKTSIEFGVRGTDRLGRILSRLPQVEREGVLGDLMSRDPAGAEGVERSLFPFEKIGTFKAEELRRLIVTVPYQDWGTALRGAPTELLERILTELPPGTRNLVADAAGNPQPRDKVLECRSKILSQVYTLASRGLIELNREGASERI